MKPHTIFISDGNRVPIGTGQLTFQHGSWWITSVLASRTAPRGTGKDILKNLCAWAREQGWEDVRLGTNWTNYPMLYAALHSGFVLDGTDKNGYVLSRSFR